MKKFNSAQLAQNLTMPLSTGLVGLLLLLDPGMACALAGKLLGLVCIITAVPRILRARGRRNRVRRILYIVLAAIGLWMMLNPMFVTDILGRVLGAFLLFEGITNGKLNMESGKGGLSLGMIISAVTVVAGVVLVLMPQYTSQLFFRVVGIVMIGVAVAIIADRMGLAARLPQGQSRQSLPRQNSRSQSPSQSASQGESQSDWGSWSGGTGTSSDDDPFGDF